jgi:hypothetical protein
MASRNPPSWLFRPQPPGLRQPPPLLPDLSSEALRPSWARDPVVRGWRRLPLVLRLILGYLALGTVLWGSLIAIGIATHGPPP